MIQKWVVTEAIRQNPGWQQYFEQDDAIVSGRTSEGSGDGYSYLVIDGGCPDEDMILELLAALYDYDAPETEYYAIEQILSNICVSDIWL